MKLNNIPKHIAIIMDGNGRWAKSKKLPRAIGHKNGVKSVQIISELCSKLKVEYLTLYTLSLENFSRPKLELKSLMTLLSSTIKSEIKKMKENNIQFNVIGFRNKLPQKINDQLDFAIFETKDNDVTRFSTGSISKVTLLVAIFPYSSIYVAVTCISPD